MKPSRSTLLRDVVIFQVKLWLDGLKDVVISPLSLAAAAVDFVFGPGRRGYRFYRVMKLGEKMDRQLNLFSAAEAAETSEEGLFAGSEPGDHTLLGTLEGASERRRHPPRR